MTSSVKASIAEKIDLSMVGETDTLLMQLRKLSKTEIVSFFRSVQSSLPVARKTSSRFSYLGNSASSGFRTITSSLVDRAARLKEACYFSACYADQLVLHDPFVLRLDSLDEERVTPLFTEQFSFFLSSLIMMEPLLEKRIISFCRPEGTDLCSKCFIRLAGEVDHATPVTHFASDLHMALANAAQVRLIAIDVDAQKCTARIEGPESVFGDTHLQIDFDRERRVLRNKDIGKLIPKNKLISLGVLGPYADNFAQDTATMAVAAKEFGIRKSFSSSSEVALLKRAFGDNRFLTSPFEADAPILLAESLEDLIALREEEWHHFETFRSALHGAFEGSNDASIEEKYQDLFLPELIKIERILEKNRNVKGKDIIKGSGAAALTITSSVMTAGFSTMVAAAAGVLGANHFGKEMVPAVRDYLDVPDEAKDSQYYFAWKLKNKDN